MNSANALAAVATMACLPAWGADRIGMMVIQAPPQTKNSCKVATSEKQMEMLLKNVRAKEESANRPQIDFDRNAALILATLAKKAHPVGISQLSLTVLLEDQEDFESGTGTLVLAVPPTSLKTCSAVYAVEQIAERPRGSDANSDHGVVSVNSASSQDELAVRKIWRVEKKPTLPSQASADRP